MLPPFIAGPIAANLCTLVDCKTILTLDDVWGLNELLLVRSENERRAHKAAEAKAKSRRGR